MVTQWPAPKFWYDYTPYCSHHTSEVFFFPSAVFDKSVFSTHLFLSLPCVNSGKWTKMGWDYTKRILLAKILLVKI